MNAMKLAHPTPEMLADFGSGRLDESASAEVYTHLSACDTCMMTLERLPEDGFVSRLRATVRTPGPEATSIAEDTPSAACPIPAALADHPRYRIVQLLGSGGMGAVYKAEHRLMERPVALKVINSRLLDKPAAVERFRREVRAAARLAHPNIVAAYDAEQAGDTHFLVMEFVDGINLSRLVVERGPLPVVLACDYVRQAALGLQHAHEQGMVHRDIKPHNLVLAAGPEQRSGPGIVKILDFGLARFLSENASADALTQSNSLMGTPDYIAPDQARSARRADIRADIYSLGCTLYHLLAGHPPFPEGTSMEKLAAHLERKPKPLAELRKDVPPELSRIVEKMMAKDPARRYQTPVAVAEALDSFASSSPSRQVPFAPRRRSALAAATILLVAVGLAGYAYGPAVYRITTNQGHVVIETNDPDIQLVVKQGGEEIKIVDAKSNKEVNLKAGKYEVELAEGKDGLRLSTNEFTLERGGRQIVKVTVEATAVGEIRRFEGHIEIHALAVSGDGARAVTGSWDQTVRVWDVARGKELRCFNVRDDRANHAIYCVALSRDGKMALAGSRQGTVWLWDVETGAERGQCTVPVFETVGATAVAFSPDGQQALVGGGDGVVRLWQISPWKELNKRLQHSRKNVWSVCFSPDGRQALTAGGSDDSGGGIRLWDLETVAEIRQFRGHEQGLWCAVFSPDGRRVLSGSNDATLRLWDADTGKELRRLKGHTRGVTCVAFLPDGRQALSGGQDQTLRLWDLETGKELYRFVDREGEIGGLASMPRGRQALFGNFQGTVRLWQLPP